METVFPFVEVPEELWAVVGEPDGNSRVYRREGPQEEVGDWFDAVCEIVGDVVSPGGVSMYCPVSRAAVHKRIREGRLSLFLFHVTSQKNLFFGKTVTHRNTPFGYVPVSEAKAWKRELEERAVSQGLITLKELEGSKPDWAGDFVEWKSRWRKQQARNAKRGKP